MMPIESGQKKDSGNQKGEDRMKKSMIVLLVMVFVTTALSGAVQVKKEKEVVNWSGFYVGLNAGFARYEPNWTDDDYDWFGGTLIDPYSSLLPGATLGYNHQYGSLVIGFEVDGSMGFMENEIKYSFDPTPAPGTYDVTKTDKLGLLFTAWGRMGFVIDKALFYLTAGVAMPSAEHTWIENSDPSDSWPTFKSSNLGMVVGLGFEHRLGGGLTIKVEYLQLKNSPKIAENADKYKMSVVESLAMLRLGFNLLF
jgi:outer membrane immunogenic protein